MTSPEPARTPLAERLSPVPGPSGINLRPREGKNDVDVEGKSKGGRGGRMKKGGQAGSAGGSGSTGQQPPSRGARAKRGGGKKVTFGNPPPHNHKDKSKAPAAIGRGGGGAGRHVYGNRKSANPNTQSEALKGKKVRKMGVLKFEPMAGEHGAFDLIKILMKESAGLRFVCNCENRFFLEYTWS